MKKIFFIALGCFVLVNLTNCKKDPLDIPIGTIRVDVAGNEKPFSVNAKATRLAVTGGYGIQVHGHFKASSTTNLSFSIASPNLITAGTYTENANSNPLVTMTHCIEVLFPCVIQTSSYGSTSNPVSITITEISGTSVKGTFRGELSGGSGSGGTPSKELLTKGVFYVSF